MKYLPLDRAAAVHQRHCGENTSRARNAFSGSRSRLFYRGPFEAIGLLERKVMGFSLISKEDT